MKSTEHFKNTIQGYLDQRALKDVLFAESYYKVIASDQMYHSYHFEMYRL